MTQFRHFFRSFANGINDFFFGQLNIFYKNLATGAHTIAAYFTKYTEQFLIQNVVF